MTDSKEPSFNGQANGVLRSDQSFDQPGESWVSIVLAGGQSRRMGTCKALLPYDACVHHDQCRYLIEHIVHTVKPFSSEVVVVTRTDEQSSIAALFEADVHVHVICDEGTLTGKGPLAGMYTGMAYSKAMYYFVTACDMPEVDGPFLAALQRSVHGPYDAWIPKEGERLQVMAGVYRNVAGALLPLLQSGEHAFMAALEKLHIYEIEQQQWRGWTCNEAPFFNLNEPWQYKQWIARRRDSNVDDGNNGATHSCGRSCPKGHSSARGSN